MYHTTFTCTYDWKYCVFPIEKCISFIILYQHSHLIVFYLWNILHNDFSLLEAIKLPEQQCTCTQSTNLEWNVKSARGKKLCEAALRDKASVRLLGGSNKEMFYCLAMDVVRECWFGHVWNVWNAIFYNGGL